MPTKVMIAALVLGGLLAQPAQSAPASRGADAVAVRKVLADYRQAIERLDARGTEQLFASDSELFETGAAEGPYAAYLKGHLAPELAKFRAFDFSDEKTSVRFVGAAALATETYRYRIETAKGEIVERMGAATSVLRKDGGRWKIVMMHNSARAPKPTP